MKANFSFDFTELDRRTVRASVGRAGQATRKELRIFVERAIRTALHAAPEPKPKRQKKVAPPPPRPVELVAGDVLCVCGLPKDDHGRMGFTCPPGTDRVKGTRRMGSKFTPAVSL
jgi:hypothetical protein